MEMKPEDYAAAQRRIVAGYDLALKALGIDGVPPPANATEAELTLMLTRRASVMLTMALTDLYIIDARRRGPAASEALIEQFATEVPPSLEKQVGTSCGTPVEELLKALLQAARKGRLWLPVQRLQATGGHGSTRSG